MKPVLLQNLIKKNRKETTKIDPTPEEVNKSIDTVFGWILAGLAIMVIGSIAIGA